MHSVKRSTWYDIVCLVISSLFLSSSAFYNGFPFVFNADTAMYMEAVNRGVVGSDRPILYGLFMRYASLGISLWCVVIIQSLLLSVTLFFYFKYFLEREKDMRKQGREKLYYLAFCALISFLMGGSFTSSWLMPDIFTPILILSMGLLLFVELKPFDKFSISLIGLLTLGMHNSHPYTCIAILALIAFSAVFENVRKVFLQVGLRTRKILYVLLLVIVSQILVSLLHYNFGGGFKSSKGGAIFFMGSLVEMGVAKQYLDDNCGRKFYFICQYKDSLPRNFLWSLKSPIYKNGGWDNNDKEYTAIIKDILTTPRYLKLVVSGSLKATIKQFFHYGTGEAYKPWIRVSKAIIENYPEDYLAFDKSRQNTGQLSFILVNYSQTIFFALSVMFYAILLLKSKTSNWCKLLMIYILLSLIINAWFLGTFSGVFHRYQSKVIWLMPLPLFLYLINKTSSKEL